MDRWGEMNAPDHELGDATDEILVNEIGESQLFEL
jgi:hypothetical protein